MSALTRGEQRFVLPIPLLDEERHEPPVRERKPNRRARVGAMVRSTRTKERDWR